MMAVVLYLRARYDMMLDELFGLKSSLVWSLGDPYDFYQYIQLPTVTNPSTRGPYGFTS